jgi:hypothetical protein
MKKYSVLPSYPNKISKNVYQEGLVVFQVASIKYIMSKVFGNVKNPYIINQNHIFSKNYYEVISG